MTQTRPETQPGPTLSDLSLRRDERGFLLGGVGSGKSELAERLGRDWVTRYASLKGRRLILDPKPRYRAEYTVQGYPAKRRYKSWEHGQPVPGSIVVDDPADLKLAFDQSPTVIVQGEGVRDIPRLMAAADRFLRDSRHGRPQLCQVDETMDFFHANGMPRGGDDIMIRLARAGRERGTAVVYCSQRTKGVPATLIEELNRAYVFMVDAVDDAKVLVQMGAPRDILTRIPRRKHEFIYWTKLDRAKIWGPYKLALD